MVTSLEENGTFIKVIFFNTRNENKAAGVRFHLRQLYGNNKFFVLARYISASTIWTEVTRISQWSDNFGTILSYYFPLKSLLKCMTTIIIIIIIIIISTFRLFSL